MRWDIAAALLIIAGWCVGCEPPIAAAAAQGQAKISITRENEESLSVAPVHISINGKHLVDLAKGQTYSGGIPAGSVSLTAKVENDWGHYTLHFTAAPGKTYTFLVEKNVRHSLVVGVGAVLAGAIGVLAATAVDTGDESGMYKITPVSPTQ
jgi:hydroxymethylglutaryl-CoA reductase